MEPTGVYLKIKVQKLYMKNRIQNKNGPSKKTVSELGDSITRLNKCMTFSWATQTFIQGFINVCLPSFILCWLVWYMYVLCAINVIFEQWLCRIHVFQTEIWITPIRLIEVGHLLLEYWLLEWFLEHFTFQYWSSTESLITLTS